MLARHALTILAVRDLNASLRFYRDAFWWPAAVATPVYMELALPGGARLGLYEREAFARNTGLLPSETDGITATELYFAVDDPEATVRRLLASGARQLSPLSERPWGDAAAYFADPDGNVVVVARLGVPEPREVGVRWMETWRGGDVAILDEVHAADFVDHAPGGDGTFADGVRALYAAFPDFVAVTEAMALDGEVVTIRWTATGTHRGAFLGVAPTGRVVRFRGIEVLTVREGKVRERWGEWDGLGLFEQLRG
jgi:predicted ester cyclase/predicted enzyme related to lactoylglutathione lyase